MIEKSEIKALNQLKSKGKIVSLYLDVDQESQTSEVILKVLKNLLKKVDGVLSDEDIKKVAERVKLRLAKETKGLAFFIGSKQNIWYEYCFKKPVNSGIFIENNVHIKPLLWMLDEYERYLTIFLDKESARIFITYMGEIEDITNIVDKNYPGKHSKGGMSQQRFGRDTERHMKENLKKFAKEIHKLYKKKKFNRIILSGSKEVLPEFEKMMHNEVRRLVAGKFLSEKWQSIDHVLEQSMKVEEKAEREHEAEMVKVLSDNLGDGNKAVSGIRDVVQAANDKKAMKLIVSKDFMRDGYSCEGCGLLSINDKCDCKGSVEKVDLVDELMQKCIAQGAEVEIVKESSKLDELGGIGAILRY